MARAILTLPLAAALCLSPVHGAGPTACSAKHLDSKVQALQQRLAAGAFYKELLLRFGRPLTCTVDVQEERTTLTYAFRLGALLTATTDPKIEFSEQTVKQIHLDTASAIALLRRAEKNAYQPGGCGISWKNAEEESDGDRREVVYRGDNCNCQARLIYQGKYVSALVLRSAC